MDQNARNASNFRLFAPGRICLFGEHSDWAGQIGSHPGYCLVVGTDQGLWASARASQSLAVQSVLPSTSATGAERHRRMTCPWNAELLLEAAKDQEEFFRYCAAVAYEMMQVKGVKGAIELHIDRMDLPLKKGVSSSAAVCVLVASAFSQVYGLGLFPHELMELAYRGERLTGSQCGRMDQACIFGKTPVLLMFRGSNDIRIEPLFPAEKIEMFFVDLAGKKNTVTILADLQAAYPKSPALREALGTENESIVRRAYRALTSGEASLLGELMLEAQQVFDAKVAPHCPQELESPLLHQVLRLPEIQSHVFGGKGVGSQGDGTAQFVARSAEDRDAAMRILAEKFPSMHCFPLTIVPSGAGR